MLALALPAAHLRPRTCSFIGLGAGPHRLAARDGHRARLPVEPRHQLRGRRPRRSRGRAARGHGRQDRTGRTGPALMLRGARRRPLAGAVVEMVVIRRLSKAPRVIVLVATIGVAELVQAVVRTLPDYRTGKFQTVVPEPDDSQVDDLVARPPRPRRRSTCRSTNTDHRPAAPGDHRRADRHPRRCGGCSATPSSAKSVRAIGDQPRPRPPHRHQPEDDVDRDLDDRRAPLAASR